jgi:hypothetical protein
MEIDARPADIVATGYRTADTRKDAVPIAIRVKHGQGTVVVCPGPIASMYGGASSPILRSAVRHIMAQLLEPVVRLDGEYPAVEVVLRKKDGYTLIHLINTAGAQVTGEFRHSGIVPHTGPVKLRIRLAKAPSQMILEPEGTLLTGEYDRGVWHGLIPDLHVHSMIRVS